MSIAQTSEKRHWRVEVSLTVYVSRTQREEEKGKKSLAITQIRIYRTRHRRINQFEFRMSIADDSFPNEFDLIVIGTGVFVCVCFLV